MYEENDDFRVVAFLVTALVFAIFIVIVICFLRVILRFIQQYGSQRNTKSNSEENPVVNNNKKIYVLPEHRIPMIVRSNVSPRSNVQPIRKYSNYRVPESRDEVDLSSHHLTVESGHHSDGDALLRHPDQSIPVVRPSSYQEAMAASRESLITPINF